MSAGIRDRAFEAPIHVMPGPDGTVRLLLPDGHSITLELEAAARSALLLTRAAVGKGRQRVAARAQRRIGDCLPGGEAAEPGLHEVIPVDFVHHARILP
jgi:hypothetical protein